MLGCMPPRACCTAGPFLPPPPSAGGRPTPLNSPRCPPRSRPSTRSARWPVGPGAGLKRTPLAPPLPCYQQPTMTNPDRTAARRGRCPDHDARSAVVVVLLTGSGPGGGGGLEDRALRLPLRCQARLRRADRPATPPCHECLLARISHAGWSLAWAGRRVSGGWWLESIECGWGVYWRRLTGHC